MQIAHESVVTRAPALRVRHVLAPLLVMMVVYLIYAWDRVVVPVELVEVRQMYGLSVSASSLVASIFTFGLALTALPAGMFLARWGLRTTLVLGVVLFSVCTLYVPLGHSTSDLFVARVVAGIGEGFYNVAMYSFLAGLTLRYRGSAAGIATTLFGLGMFSGPPVIAGIQHFTQSWQQPFIALGVVGLIGAVILQFLAPRHVTTETARAGRVDERSMLTRLGRVLTRRTTIILFAAAANGVGVYAFISIYVTYLRTVWHFPQETAAFVFSAYGLGGLLGGIPMGYIADRVGRRPFLIVAMILAGIAGAAAFGLAPAVWPALCANFLLGMLLNGSYSNCYAAIQDEVDPQDIPIATGLLATIYFLTASFSGWLLVTSAGHYGWFKGSVLVYTAPYWICAVLFFFTKQLGKRSTATEAD